MKVTQVMGPIKYSVITDIFTENFSTELVNSIKLTTHTACDNNNNNNSSPFFLTASRCLKTSQLQPQRSNGLQCQGLPN